MRIHAILMMLAFPLTVHADVGQQRAEAAGRSIVGSPAPQITLKTIDDQTINLSQLYGRKAVYLKFWATWCVPCREQMPKFQQRYEAAGDDLAVIAVNVGLSDTPDVVQAFRKQYGLTMPVVIDDGRLAAALNLQVTPQHIVIGRDARIQYVGHLENEKLDIALLAARNSKPASSTAVASADSTRAPTSLTTLPQRSLASVTGESIALRDSTAPTVLVFFSSWCESYLMQNAAQTAADCTRVREQVSELSRDSKVRWIGIASHLWATRDDVVEYASDYKVGMPLIFDEQGELFRSFRATRLPTLIFADRTGRVVRRVEGVDENLSRHVTALIYH